jgi:quinoprotein glucose dehydrogenase
MRRITVMMCWLDGARKVAALAMAAAFSAGAACAADEWSAYGHDAGGQRFSPLSQINRGNVSKLKVAWTFHTGDIADGTKGPRSGFETTPLYVDSQLYLTTPFNRVIALDPVTGKQVWAYDPLVDRGLGYGDGLINRGLATWVEPHPRKGGACQRRLFEATLDARLIALDARTGRPCGDFGSAGQVSLRDVQHYVPGWYHETSPPAVIDDVVVVGSAIDDNVRAQMPDGVVRAYDVRTGALRWSWEPLVPAPNTTTGAGNAWSVMAVDPARHLVFVPTGSASPDYYGGLRPGDDRWADSVVALDSRTGKLAWGFQLVHHDLWDYDTAAPVMLADIPHDKITPVVIAGNKTGMVYVLGRTDGHPVFPVTERPVPQSDVPGEMTSPTQPFSSLPAVAPQTLDPADAWGPTPADKAACRQQLEALTGRTIFTPPSPKGILAIPGNVGGINWSGYAYDNAHDLLIVAATNLPFKVKLIPRDDYPAETRNNTEPHTGFGAQIGTPYGLVRTMLFGPSNLPCIAPPWGSLKAIDVKTGKLRWTSPLGSFRELGGPDEPNGSMILGGPMVTAGGLVFTAGTLDRRLHVFDVQTGKEVWTPELPASAHAMPMTYEAGGRQYVVVAAGGSPNPSEERQGDALVAFALPDVRN